ncbi:MAG: WYL domain-containing protein [Thermomicrobiales bacterium]
MARLPETTRIARILEMVWLISRQPRHWTRAALAEKFEISERMVTQDIQVIRHGLVFDLQSAYGEGYYFPSLPSLPAVSYSLPEALALILAAQSARQLSGISQSDLATAIARLSAVIPDELREMVERLGASTPSTPADDHRQFLLAAVSHAISLRRQIHISYASASRDGAETERTVDPYAIVPYLRSWHMIGYCHLRDDVRVFKLDRIGDITTLQTSFEPEPDFDLAAFLGEGWGLMRGLDVPVEAVEILFDQPAARWVAEEHWHTSQKLDWLPDERLRFRVRIQITPEFQRWLFRYGSQVDVVAPDHLRAWMLDEARAVLERSESRQAQRV